MTEEVAVESIDNPMKEKMEVEEAEMSDAITEGGVDPAVATFPISPLNKPNSPIVPLDNAEAIDESIDKLVKEKMEVEEAEMSDAITEGGVDSAAATFPISPLNEPNSPIVPLDNAEAIDESIDKLVKEKMEVEEGKMSDAITEGGGESAAATFPISPLNEPNSPIVPLDNANFPISKTTEDPNSDTRDSFEDDEMPKWGTQEADQQQRILLKHEQRHFAVVAAQNEAQVKLCELNALGAEYLKSADLARKVVMNDVEKMYILRRKINNTISKHQREAAVTKEKFTDAHKAYENSFQKLEELQAIRSDTPKFPSIVHGVDNAMHSSSTFPILPMASTAYNETWTRRYGERRSVTVRFLESVKPASESDVNNFYKVVERSLGKKLPEYDDYHFGQRTDIRFIFNSIKETERFKEYLYGANFVDIKVESIKWIDMKHARNALDNENLTYITRQMGSDAKDKEDRAIQDRRNRGGLYTGSARVGYGEMLSGWDDGTLTPPSLQKTPTKPWSDYEDDLANSKQSSQESVASLVHSSVPSAAASDVPSVPSAASSDVPSAPSLNGPSTLSTNSTDAAVTLDQDVLKSKEDVEKRIAHLSHLVFEAATAGKTKKEAEDMMKEIRELQGFVTLILFCDGNFEEAKKIKERRETPV